VKEIKHIARICDTLRYLGDKIFTRGQDVRAPRWGIPHVYESLDGCGLRDCVFSRADKMSAPQVWLHPQVGLSIAF
jgi:hypothetical protein